ncbi:uncharacterized protein N7482_001729 [Penicillium canariense]|uniref:Bromo domain-containing protein n=1 Tax=Penicillium canariense TaxID=189055 RepID=A0A9W9IG78_9EURO|nr:uncharacterized protein N7482_001729 [Penicillium canariense]KAJ5175852.1 hypothetical protein N7482_001729 [Penicillium canariense]
MPYRPYLPYLPVIAPSVPAPSNEGGGGKSRASVIFSTRGPGRVRPLLSEPAFLQSRPPTARVLKSSRSPRIRSAFAPRPTPFPSLPTINVAPIPKALPASGRPGGQWGMPPLSAYTSFESLLFFQSLATSDVRPASFASISALLSNNPLVRQNVAFSADRLSPEALEDLYATLLRDGFDRDHVSTALNGRSTETSGPSNPKKRKISSPRPEGLADGLPHAVLVPELVSYLYARYKERVTKEIRDDEKRYAEIKTEIERLQKEGAKSTVQAAKGIVAPQATKPERGELMDIDVKQETPRHEHPDQPIPRAKQAPAGQPIPQGTKPESSQSRDIPRPGGLPVALGPPGAQSPHAPIQPTLVKAGQSPQPQTVNGQNIPHPPAQPSLPPKTLQPGPSTPAAARITPAHPSQVAPRPNTLVATPIPPGKAAIPPSAPPQPTPTKSSFQQWQLEAPPHSPYSATSPTTVTPQVSSAAAKQPLPLSPQVPSRTQSKASISSAVPSTPGVPTSAAQTPVPIGYPRISQTPSGVIPSYSESRGSRPRLSIDTPGSCTPWKRTPRLSIPESPASPDRPRPEDVSPISERAPSPDAMDISPPRERKITRRSQATVSESKGSAPSIKIEKGASARRKRAISSASTQSRGRSVVSRDESPDPSRSATRRKAAVAIPDDQTPKGRSKRKRGVSESMDQEPILPEQPKIDTTKYVLCTRGFHRTAAPILNDVTTHKLASIFAKPLGERDAPGYHDLIYRPQDLKSIKSAVHQGSKAVAAATEAVSTPAGDGESPVPAAGTPSKNNVLMLQKTEDLIPPKGIVNSAQLEKEFIRMFANAIMFNPVPERGLGPAFPMRNERGSRESTQSGDGDEGGIIQDSLEMFEDVEQAVTHWRQAERTAERNADELANKNVLALRRGSASDFNTDSADDVKG